MSHPHNAKCFFDDQEVMWRAILSVLCMSEFHLPLSAFAMRQYLRYRA